MIEKELVKFIKGKELRIYQGFMPGKFVTRQQ
jgi:hypothetical protein